MRNFDTFTLPDTAIEEIYRLREAFPRLNSTLDPQAALFRPRDGTKGRKTRDIPGHTGADPHLYSEKNQPHLLAVDKAFLNNYIIPDFIA